MLCYSRGQTVGMLGLCYFESFQNFLVNKSDVWMDDYIRITGSRLLDSASMHGVFYNNKADDDSHTFSTILVPWSIDYTILPAAGYLNILVDFSYDVCKLSISTHSTACYRYIYYTGRLCRSSFNVCGDTAA